MTDDNLPPGASSDIRAPYNYDPEEKIECDHCKGLINIEDAKEWNHWKFCDDICLNLFLEL